MAGSAPDSRRDRQLQTRRALIFAARDVFARDGYSGASLDAISREAGFSKGAVYSNFDSKSELFLAVMDENIAAAHAEGGWDLFASTPESEGGAGTGRGPDDAGGRGSSDADGADAAGDTSDTTGTRGAGAPASDPVDAELQLAMRGFALATLEFIAAAARDERLADELGRRMRVLDESYAEMAASQRDPDDPLSPIEIGSLLAALDQGIALVTVAGGALIDQRLMRAGLQRLLDPTRAVREGVPESAERDPEDGTRPPSRPALHDEVTRRRIRASLDNV